jgi:plasmid maintenance system killer protein
MIVSIRHSTLQSLFEKGTATGISWELKDLLLLWLSVIQAAKDLRDLSIKNISIVEKGVNNYRLKVHGVGTFSFRLVDEKIRQLDYKDDFAKAPSSTARLK